ncbi:hypothetical protein GIB67_024312 [Kingdonia uniflora]|uniref:DUF4283 domain-containing protein n=1 Tax=Kingdonia uniflora TaxID=39325 RepID=A0A7J7LF89_9MAGN|nr:hypothetical protein GIB67_024312 [Kingdonia uniflora]
MKVKLAVARSEAMIKWKLIGKCQFIPLGKGYFTILLGNEADKLRIWGGGPWHIEGQLLRVTMWTPDFDISKQKNTHAMVWVKFPGLGTEYWEEDVLMSMARTVGNPVQVDSYTLCRNTGFNASVLVDVDFSKPVPTKIMVEREGFEFCQEVQLGRTPKLCSHYKVVGHLVSECRDVVKEIEQEKVVQNEADKEPKKKRRNRKKIAKAEQDKPGTEEGAAGLKNVDKQKEPIIDKNLSTNQPNQPRKTFNGVVEMWDRTIRNWDGSLNSQEVDKEASLVNKSWADMVEEVDSSIQVHEEEGKSEGSSESESHGSEFNYNIGNGYSDEVVYQTQQAKEWHNVLSRRNIRKNKSKASNFPIAKQQTRRQASRRFPDLLCIVEPKVKPDENKLRRKNFFSMEREVIFFDNGLSYPNIWVLWRKGLKKPVALACSRQHITVLFENVMISCIHADCSYIRRRELWRDLAVIGASNLPWIVVGDFNVVLRAGEKKGGRGVRWRVVEEFQDFVNASCLLEANSSGSEYTWCNGQMGNNKILCKLDRMLCNQAWSNLFPGWKYKVLSARVEALQQHLDSEIDNDDIARELSQANQLLTTAVNYDEELWKQKARVNWLHSGDRNIAYFHVLACIKWNKSLIHSLQTEDGRLLEEQDEIKAHIIKRRATGWAGSLLSLQGRVVLVQSVLSSILIYSMGIYKWSASLIKEGERILRNFFWSGEPDSRKACVVAWDKVRKPFKEGGINLRRLKAINQSLMMKLSWNFLNPMDGWSEFMRAKFISKSGNFSRISKGSSIWAGVRGAIEDVRAHSGWVIGDGASIDLWRDNWCSSLFLKDWINDDHIPWNDLHAKLSSIIVEGRWAIPGNLQLLF